MNSINGGDTNNGTNGNGDTNSEYATASGTMTPLSGGGTGTNNNSAANSCNNEQQQDKHMMNATYTPPLWLTGETKSSRSSTNKDLLHNKKSKFTISLPVVPKLVRNRIQKFLQDNETPYAHEKKQILNLQLKLQEQQKRVKQIETKIVTLKQKKDVGLKDIRDVRKKETVAALEKLEKRMIDEHDVQEKEHETKWLDGIKNDYDKKRKLEEQDREKEYQAVEEKEIQKKKQKLQELEMESKRKVSERLEKAKSELDASKKTLDNYQEKRTEIVWLLKQVIKAEEKQKAKVTVVSSDNTKKPEAKTFVSKGA